MEVCLHVKFQNRLRKFPGHKCEKLSDFQDKGQFLLLPGHFQDPNGIPGHFQDGWPPYIYINIITSKSMIVNKLLYTTKICFYGKP